MSGKGVPHKHADVIKAWADGAQIQYLDYQQREWWVDCVNPPEWRPDASYRVKPKPDRTYRQSIAEQRGSLIYVTGFEHLPNVEYTFDGETGQLKDVRKI